MLNFIALDFETANQHRSSVCSIGLVIVKDGVVVDSFYKLIKPYPNFYSKWNTAVHGLTNCDTENAPTFPEVWQSLEPKIGKLPLVAHNSPFDRGCLMAVFNHYNMPYPNYEFYCTLKAARRAFRSLSNHKLTTVAQECGFILNNHHHALADAEACAHIAIKIL